MSKNRELKYAITVPTPTLASTDFGELSRAVVRTTKHLNHEPQNIEGKENFIIRNSLFDIRYSK
jgi:hypothetical protein